MQGDGESSVSAGMEGATGEENNPAQGDAASQGTIFHRMPGAVNVIETHGGHERLGGDRRGERQEPAAEGLALHGKIRAGQ